AAHGCGPARAGRARAARRVDGIAARPARAASASGGRALSGVLRARARLIPSRAQGDFRVLGPLEVQCEGEPVQVAAGKQRALLARLLLYANRAVSREQIVDALWSEDPPETAHKMVQIHVSQLRKSLPETRLHTRAPGYLLEVRDEELDLARF